MISPGSRNAPLIMAFTADPDFTCYSVPDERSAAFTAMGMTLEDHRPVAVICTSGSAAMNFYPAVAEAFYQKLPLVAITADRPLELIDQGVGQTVRQQKVYGEHVVGEANLLRESGDDLTKAYNQRLINQVMLASVKGPVHINVPFDEPLYDFSERDEEDLQVIREVPSVPSPPDLTPFAKIWNASKRIMILAGHMPPDERLVKAVESLNRKSPFLLLTETVTNLPVDNAITTIDRVVNTIDATEKQDLQPDLLITIGGEIVSKMIKQFLSAYPSAQHWHLSDTGEVRDTFQQLKGVIRSEAARFFEVLTDLAGPGNPEYRDKWLRKAALKQDAHLEYVKNAPASDLAAFETIFRTIPKNTVLHSANSASIRYAQLFKHDDSIRHYTNRGTSGIDGCTSTALGHSLNTPNPVVLLTGDIAFLYDSNAFWNDRLPSNFRVIVINNRGGNIFRIIKGPKGQENFERFQETTHNLNLSGVADTFGIEYQKLEELNTLEEILPEFLDLSASNGPRILEIVTPRLESPEVLEKYFEYIRSQTAGIE